MYYDEASKNPVNNRSFMVANMMIKISEDLTKIHVETCGLMT